MHRKPIFKLTKIIATVGPACSSIETFKKCISEGVRVFRINFSHGSFEEYDEIFDNIRLAAEEAHVQVGIMGDLSGPKIRIGKVIDGGIQLKKGDEVKFINEETITGTDNENLLFSTNYKDLIKDVKRGQNLLLDDGAIKMKCVAKGNKNDYLKCTVINDALITSNKGLNLPDTELSIPALTEKDYKCAKYAVEKGFDFLALSFVKTADDVIELIDYLASLGARPRSSEFKMDKENYSIQSETNNFLPIISKIEKPQSVKNLDEILEVTDCVMVARGDLGVEMELSELPITQKRIIDKCFNSGVPVIVATQMLQSMIKSPTPTRAEVSDVSNAIFDGADAVMLSGETSIGQYPVETVQIMNNIAINTNDYLREIKKDRGTPRKLQASRLLTPALANGVKTLVNDIDAKLIVVWAQSDGTAVYLSKHHLNVPIIACSNSKKVLRRMSLMHGLRPIYMEQPKSSKEFIDRVDEFLSYRRWVGLGEPIVMVMGEPFNKFGVTNKINIHFVGD